MAYRFKNTTASTLTHGNSGIALLPSVYYDASIFDTVKLYDQEMIGWINNGTVVINDGTYDLNATQANGQLSWTGWEGRLVHTTTTISTTTNGTVTLTAETDNTIYLTGTASGFKINMPDAGTIQIGEFYRIFNTTSNPIDVRDNSGTVLFTLSQNSFAQVALQLNGTAAGTWRYWQILLSSTASGLINYNLISSTTFTTTSTSDVLITGFSVTPQAGTYAVFYNGSSYLTTTPKAHWWSVYKAGVKVADSERQQDTSHSNQTMVDSTMTIISVNGSQTVDVRVRTSNGSLSIYQRSLLLLRLGT